MEYLTRSILTLGNVTFASNTIQHLMILGTLLVPSPALLYIYYFFEVGSVWWHSCSNPAPRGELFLNVFSLDLIPSLLC